ncbi:hypothetical protein [Clostridium perfringens]|uniref:hypothetical protein n=1 Tax=Clostridium perfringens TaxID=1502 RepID=UPI0013E2DBF0|nr:hypothetical protein [Clostridium perfringens]NGT04429.1 hypothetical protein [Clostridium perfringens]
MDVRITYTSKDELEKILQTLRDKHNIISISKPYPNLRSRNVGEYRVYIKLEF